jgi:hypothetical protein
MHTSAIAFVDLGIVRLSSLSDLIVLEDDPLFFLKHSCNSKKPSLSSSVFICDLFSNSNTIPIGPNIIVLEL